MSTEPPPSFGALLRQYRHAAGLTQEELAERARLSRGAIDTLERGTRRTPRKETIALLAEALALTASERALLEATARQHDLPFRPTPTPSGAPPGSPPAPPQTATVALPGLAPHLPPEPPTPGLLSSADAGSDAGPEAGHPPTMQALSPTLLADGRSRHSTLPSFAQVVRAMTHPQLSLRAGGGLGGVGAGPGRALLAVALLATLLGGGLLYARGPGAAALFGQHSPTRGGKLCLASDFPTTGDLAGEGKPAQNAVELAVLQNLNLGAGYTLDFVGYDDASARHFEDPERGAHNVADMVQTPCIMGLVGPWSSFMAPPEMVIAAPAGLAVISPNNTNPGLTLRQYVGPSGYPFSGYSFDQVHPPGKKLNYFRIPPHDVLQGKADADFTIDPLAAGLNATRAYVVRDPLEDYSDDLAGGFTAEFLAKGGTILGTETIPLDGGGHAQPAGLSELAARIEATRPQAVYYAGDTPDSAIRLRAQLVVAGYTGPLVSDDGIALDPAFAGPASQTANSVFATVPAPDLSTFTSGAAEQFILSYHGWYPNQDLDGVSANAYDAAMILITAIKNVIRSGTAVTREAVVDQVQHIRYAGVTGQIAFDKYGDNSFAVLSFYTVRDGKWVFLKQVRA